MELELPISSSFDSKDGILTVRWIPPRTFESETKVRVTDIPNGKTVWIYPTSSECRILQQNSKDLTVEVHVIYPDLNLRYVSEKIVLPSKQTSKV